MSLSTQILSLFILAMPISCIAWTVTKEEVFREPREYCTNKCKTSKTILKRKFFYLFTCEYCFSHYVTLLFLVLTDYKLLFTDWRGYLIAGFSLVWITNIYMTLFALIKQEIKKEKTEITLLENKQKI